MKEFKAGDKFGKLTLVSKEHKDHKIVWKCKCDCGAITWAQPYDLKNGRRVSCGCMKGIKTTPVKKVSVKKKRIVKRNKTVPQGKIARRSNPVGMVFGNLTVKKLKGTRGSNKIWECVCSCGKKVSALSHELNLGRKTCCSECAKALKPKKNKVEFSDAMTGLAKVMDSLNGGIDNSFEISIKKSGVPVLTWTANSVQSEKDLLCVGELLKQFVINI